MLLINFLIFLSNWKRYLLWVDDIQNVRMTG